MKPATEAQIPRIDGGTTQRNCISSGTTSEYNVGFEFLIEAVVRACHQASFWWNEFVI